MRSPSVPPPTVVWWWCMGGITLPPGLSSLLLLDLGGNQLARLTLPLEMKARIESGLLFVYGFHAAKITYYRVPVLQITSITMINGSSLELAAGGAEGMVAIDVSPDLETWSEQSRFLKAAGEQIILIPTSSLSQYFRLREVE